MKDTNDNIIYVGKSINLRNRVRQYFQESSQQNLKTRMMAIQIKSFEYIVTNNEVEALILENNLIKSNRPRYNVALKDDKTYPYIKITKEMFPRIVKVRQVRKDGARYFGPYSDFVANETLAIIHSIWPLRTSKKVFPRDLNRGRPCLNYHIGKCQAPCMGLVSEPEYEDIIVQVVGFLEGKYEDLIKKSTLKMKEAATDLNFELAARLRDQVEAVKNLSQKQTLDTPGYQDQDVMALAKEETDALVQIFFIRGGKMTGRESIFLDGVEYLTTKEILTAFVKQFYSEISFVPKEIILEEEIAEEETISQWLKSVKGQGVKIVVPQRGDKHKLAQLAAKNARLTMEQFGQELKRQKERTVGAAQTIADSLGLQSINRLEAYDISNTQGYESVGSMVVFENGRPKNSDYRKFKIKTVTGPNDYQSLQEVLERRFKRYLEKREKGEKKDETFSSLPDIIFVDGGKGQVNVAKEVLETLGISVPVAGIVKDELHFTRGIIYNNEEINFPKTGEAFRLISKIQDEVHRFAIEYHRKLRKQTALHSRLDEIDGIGPVRRAALFKKFGSMEGIRKASLEDLESTQGLNKTSAKKVHDFFKD
ncbi:MAG: excinuclease ABC subunit UvrC [Defluviitaleaceae bacterium]|nr:excinuclease ABC subunit UvrC [Defluviitaleaceae bacterium]